MKSFLAGIAQAGRELLGLNGGTTTPETFAEMCQALLRYQGEAASIALADAIHSAYGKLSAEQRPAFFAVLRDQLEPEPASIEAAISAWQQAPDPDTLNRLSQASESPRRELIRMLNLAPGGTEALIRMRADLLDLLASEPGFQVIDRDFAYVFSSWFNRGFLSLEAIDWQTPAMVLEKLIAYEAVHEIQGWDDLRRRLASDRRCFAFFHPALPGEPLIFVEVALVNGLAANVETLLSAELSKIEHPDTAIFYSISNCQRGLRGVSFGNFLIKQVVDMLAADVPSLKTYSTLSPIPGFRQWLDEQLTLSDVDSALDDGDRADLDALNIDCWHRDAKVAQVLEACLVRLCARYLVHAKRADGPRDAVARFHLRNGARLERINWLADVSPRGLQQSAGLMVNYVYERKSVLRNHEQFVNDGKIITSSTVRKLAD